MPTQDGGGEPDHDSRHAEIGAQLVRARCLDSMTIASLVSLVFNGGHSRVRPLSHRQSGNYLKMEFCSDRRQSDGLRELDDTELDEHISLCRQFERRHVVPPALGGSSDQNFAGWHPIYSGCCRHRIGLRSSSRPGWSRPLGSQPSGRERRHRTSERRSVPHRFEPCVRKRVRDSAPAAPIKTPTEASIIP